MRINILLKILFKERGSRNILKHETDKKKKNRARGAYAGYIILYVFIMFFAGLMAYGSSLLGLASFLPEVSVIALSLVVFIFALLRVNGYMFGGKDLELLMSLPFKTQEVVAARFFYMYLSELPWVLFMGIGFEIGYGLAVSPGFLTYVIWTLMLIITPLIPQVLAAVVGTLFAGAGARFKYKKAVTSLLTIVFILVCFFSSYIFRGIAAECDAESLISSAAVPLEKMRNIYIPAGWAHNAVINFSILDILLFVIVSIAVCAAVLYAISRSYRRINSKMISTVRGKAYRVTAMKTRSVAKAIAFKEFRRFMSSTTYLVNAGMGIIFLAVFAVIICITGINGLIGIMSPGSSVPEEVAIYAVPVIPVFLYLFSGMVSTTCISPSLEGKNMWIIDSLPISKSDFYRGKMLFNYLLFMPASAIFTVIIGIRIGTSPLNILLMAGCITALNLFSARWGLICGIKHMKTDWENEIQVIKRGSAVSIYLLVNMILTLAMTVATILLLVGMALGVIPLELKVGIPLIMAVWTVIGLLLAFICGKKIAKLIKK